MSSILVVEHEGRYIERIQDALSSEGWSSRFVAGRPEALRAAASEQPALVLVNSDLPGAPELLRVFARRNGGPGAVALVAEQDGEVTAGELGADDLLFKPFTDQDLRLMVRRGLSGQLGGEESEAAVSLDVPEGLDDGGPGGGGGDAATGADPETPGGKLSSKDIFGDLLAEVEQEVGDDAPAAASTPAPAAAGSAPEAESGTGKPPRAAPAPRPPRPASDDEELERRIEKTLSGVLPRSRRSAKPAPESSGKESESPPSTPPPPRKRKKRRADTDVEELLNLTLSSLEDLPRGRPAKKKAAPEPEAESATAEDGEEMFDDLDLSELDALASTGGGGRRREPAAEPEPEPAMGTALGRAVEDEDPGDASWADVAQELDREGSAPSQVQPPPQEEPPAAAAPAADRPAAEPPAEGSGDTFGPYTLEERIAVGGMAEVWKARMSGVEGFQKTVAIKKILPQMTDSTDFVNMFIDEAKLAAQLNHPNITHIYDLGKIGRDYYIAMEFVDGPNLRSLLNQARRKGLPLPVGPALLVGARLASALDYAHRKRDFDGRRLELVHRDVSPQNVLISHEGDIKLCDFGIVKAVTKVSHTEMGALKGKLQYMSPEQAWGRQVDARSDIFSLGALLFEMLTGERLFAGDSEISVLDAVRECHVRSPRDLNPAVPERAEEVVLRALEEKPEDRYSSAGELQHGLEQILYQLRPAPSQADLAAWLREVEEAPELDEAERQAFSWADAMPRPVLGEPGGETGRTTPGAEGEREGVEDVDAAAAAGAASGETVLPDDDALSAVTRPVPRVDAPAATPDSGHDAEEPTPSDVLDAEIPGEDQLPDVAAAAEPAAGAAVRTGSVTPSATLTPAAAERPDRRLDASGVGVVSPLDDADLELEEGDRRGLWLVVILILLAIFAGLVWYFVFGPGADELSFDPAPLPPPAATAPEEPAAAEPGTGGEEAPAEGETVPGEGEAGAAAEPGATARPATADDAESAGPAAGEGAAGEDSGDGVSMTDLQAIVDEQLARKEEEIRKQKEAELRRLEAELARMREQAAEDDGGGGDGR